VTEDCLQKTETYLERKGLTLVEMVNVTAHPEDSNEVVAVETIIGLEGRYGDWHLAIGC
jgi:hypothetical protein